MVPQSSQKEERVYRSSTERWLTFDVKALTLHFWWTTYICVN